MVHRPWNIKYAKAVGLGLVGLFNFGRHYSPLRVMPVLMPCSHRKTHQTIGTQFTYSDATHPREGPMCIPAAQAVPRGQ